jgi:hypothetical protein
MAALAVRFLLEICMLAALSYWGFKEHGVVAGFAAPLLAVAVWGLFVSPRALLSPGPVVVFLIELALFGVAVAALAEAGPLVFAVLLGLIYALNRAVLVWQNGSLEIEQ